ncbi:MAG: hypothetical protein BRD30_09440 [Bacteroidetes bacterium QH_2_63_10]|nr:MAG: hypothetical protein BRD30_09440 [Bacteroidetes bacterium QH_2_63_10]
MDSEQRSSPSLIAPADAVSVDGSEVTFVWKPAEGAETYLLQVAATARFEDSIVDADVGAETAVTVGNQLPTDGQTFFWRVLAETEDGTQETSSVESFIATTAAEAEHEVPVAAEEEEPVTELARAARHEATTETFDLADQFQKEKERGVAYEGVAASQIMGVSVSIILVVLVAVAILFGWYGQVSQDKKAVAMEQQQYRQIRQAEMEATKKLQQYGVVDKEEDVYRVPIDRAMELIATEEYQQRKSEK